MNKKEIQKEYNKKIKLINNYNNYYYNESSPLVSDKKYDEFQSNIIDFKKSEKVDIFSVEHFVNTIVNELNSDYPILSKRDS